METNVFEIHSSDQVRVAVATTRCRRFLFLFLPEAGPPLKGPFHEAKVWTDAGFVGQCVQAVMMMLMRRRMVRMRMEADDVGGVCGFCAGGDFQS